jgi:hypothetical protein
LPASLLIPQITIVHRRKVNLAMKHVVGIFKLKSICDFLDEGECPDPQIFLFIFSLQTHFQNDYLGIEPLRLFANFSTLYSPNQNCRLDVDSERISAEARKNFAVFTFGVHNIWNGFMPNYLSVSVSYHVPVH